MPPEWSGAFLCAGIIKRIFNGIIYTDFDKGQEKFPEQRDGGERWTTD
jgi:hypothetical protein